MPLRNVRRTTMSETAVVETRPSAPQTPVAVSGQSPTSAEVEALRQLVVSALSPSTPVLLTDIRDAGYRLTRPLPVTLEYCEGVVIACAYDVDMYGEGEDAQTALDDLCDCLLEYYEHLGEHKESLGRIPARDWRVLNELIQPVGESG